MANPTLRTDNSERASVLIVALWTVLVLSLLSVALAGLMRQEAQVLGLLEGRRQLTESADSGIKFFMAVLKDRVFQTSVSEKDLKGVMPLVGSVRTENARYVTEPEGGREVSWIHDENRYINLNRADPVMLKGLFQMIGKADEATASRLAAEVLDYRDADDAVNPSLGEGFEEDRYRKLGYITGPKNSDMEFISEVLRLPGMTEEVYTNLRDHITVYGDGRLNVNTADRACLVVVLEDVGAADKWIEVRSGADGVLGSEDDVMVSRPEDILNKISARFELTDRERHLVERAVLYNKLTTGSDHFRICLKTVSTRNARSLSIGCVFGVKTGVRYWSEAS